MEILTSESLQTRLNNSPYVTCEKRSLYPQLQQYIKSPNDGRICCLYGLRRTGKTVMMEQMMREIGQPDKTLLIQCQSDEPNHQYDTMQQVKNAIYDHPECSYIFIDEITKTKNFIGTCSVLADRFAYEGKKIVIAGTDSFGFFLAKNDELLDRVHLIHTTYIPFREYNRLLHRGIHDYMRYGGTLTDGYILYNKDKLHEYTNSAISLNIVHSLEKWNQGRNFGILEELVNSKRNDLSSFINKVIEYNNRQFLERMINRDFQSHDLGSLVELLTKHSLVDTTPIDTEEMSDRIRIFLGIKENPFNTVDQECVDIIIQYLKDLDVLYEDPNSVNKKNHEYLFTQIGMRYWQATAFAEALVTSDVFDEYNEPEKRMILQKLESDICGGLLEDIVYYQLSKDYNNHDVKVLKYNNMRGQEVDVLVEDLRTTKSIAFEIKFSDQVSEKSQLKHLLNDDFCSEIEQKTGTQIVNKIVLYRGDSLTPQSDALYLNVEDFLINTDEYMEKLLAMHVPTVEKLKSMTRLDIDFNTVAEQHKKNKNIAIPNKSKAHQKQISTENNSNR